MSIPSGITFSDSKVVARVTGAHDKADYEALFSALANNETFRPGISTSNRLIRLTASLLLIALGIGFGNWFILVLGGLIEFWGVYDRCPVWAVITRKLKREK